MSADGLFLTGGPGSARMLEQAAAQVATAVGRWAARPDADGPWPGTDPDRLAAAVAALDVCPDDGAGLQGALDALGPLLLGHGLDTTHPACLAHLHSPTLLPAAAAELAVGATNQSMDSFDQAPVATLAEDHLVRWLAGLLGLPAGASGVMTAGGTASNTLGLVLARRRAAARLGVDVAEQGTSGLAHLRILTSAAAHVSVVQAADLLGLGRRAVVVVDVDGAGRMDLGSLDRALAALAARDEVPMAVVATAGTTDLGALDPLAAVADRAAARGAWLHVDAAVGSALALSARLAPRLDGLDRADSVTADLHKLWWQPIGASALLVRDAAAFAGMRARDDYLNRADDPVEGPPNLVTRSLDTSRRFDALKVLVSLRAVGRRRLAAMVEHLVDLAADAAGQVRARSDLDLLAEPSTVMVAFRWAGAGLGADACDRVNVATQRALFASGRAVVGRTRVRGRVALKLTLVNPTLDRSDVAAVLDLVEDEARRQAAAQDDPGARPAPDPVDRVDPVPAVRA
ncbi:MAG: aspartate aminotransferase family protein [Acidimicrobiia bacterium]